MRNQGRVRRKIGVKYCGGCGPKFDRVALVERLRTMLFDSWEFVSWEDEAADHILIVVGCETACVDQGPFVNKDVHWLNNTTDLRVLTDSLEQIAIECVTR